VLIGWAITVFWTFSFIINISVVCNTKLDNKDENIVSDKNKSLKRLNSTVSRNKTKV